MTDKEIALACAARVRKGWCTNSYRASGNVANGYVDRVCSVGAMAEVMGCANCDAECSDFHTAFVRFVLGPDARVTSEALIDWNDEQPDAETVALAFERFAGARP
jgi:hypothetical protein